MDKQELIEELAKDMTMEGESYLYYIPLSRTAVAKFWPLVEAAECYHKTHHAGYAVLCSGTNGEHECGLCKALSNLKGEPK